MATLAAFAALVLVSGLPLALLLEAARGRVTGRERRTLAPSALVFDALVLGLCVDLLGVLALMRADLFGRTAAVALPLGVAVAGAIAAVAVRDRLPRPARPRADALSVGAVVVLAAALVLRREPIEFVFLTGDMGEYVNFAHSVAGGRPVTGSFPHLFTMFLAVPAALFGKSAAVSALPLTGLLLVGGLLRLGGVLRVAALPRLLVAAIVAVGAVPVWFSIFPVSEALYAPLLLAAVVFLVRAHVEERPHLAWVGGAIFLPLGLTRGNALLLVPVVVAYLWISALARGRHGPDRRFAVAALLGSSAAWAYSVEYLPEYYLHTQLERFVPATVFDAAGTLGLFSAGPALLAAVALGTAVVLGVDRIVGRWSPGRLGRWVTAWAPPAVLAAGIVLVLALGGGAIAAGTRRFGLVLPVLAVVGLGLVTWWRRVGTTGTSGTGDTNGTDPEDRTSATSELREAGDRGDHGAQEDPGDVRARLVLLAATIVAAFAAFQASRLSHDAYHLYHLYWDRYLYSEVFPMVAVGALLGAAFLWRLLGAGPRPAVAAAWVAAALVPVLLLPPALEATERPLLGDVYELMESLDELTAPATVPVVFHGYPAPPEGWGYPNTFRVVAWPLDHSWGHRVLNLPKARPFAADPMPGPREVAELMERAGAERAFVLRALPRDLPAGSVPTFGDSDVLEIRPVGEVHHEAPLLRKVPWDPDEGWLTVHFDFEVLDVRRSAPGVRS